MAHSITQNCIGCTLCARSCPVQAIDGVVKTQHVINAARCVDCGVCGRVCAKGAILDAEGNACRKIPKQEWPTPLIDTALCSACSMCVAACGRDCLAISMPVYQGDLRVFASLIDLERCVGCGLCASACPLHAITMQKEGAL